MPDFEVFSRVNPVDREAPQFTLQARGMLSFNQAAFAALEEPEAVVLLYDAKDEVVALRAEDPSHPDAHKVRRQGKARSYNVSAQAFIGHYAIPVLQALRFAGRDYGGGVWGFLLREGQPIANRRGAREPEAPFASRWRHTTNGFDVPGLMRIENTVLSHPAYMTHGPDARPSVRVATLVACDPLPQSLSTSEIRSSFLSFLESAAVEKAVSSITCAGDGASWLSWGGHGRINFETALALDGDAAEIPAASALLLVPQAGAAHHGRDPRYAELILHIEPRSPDGSRVEPVGLETWYKRFASAFDVPAAFASFLGKNLRLATADDPPVQFAVSLKCPRSITEFVDPEGVSLLPGTSPSSWFMGWAIGDRDGGSANDTTLEFLKQLCDYTLHADKYEPMLELLRNSEKIS